MAADRKLSLKEIIEDLLLDGLIDKQQAEQFLIPARGSSLEIHPLVILAQQEWQDKKTARLLNLEALSQWLANKVNLPYLRIDPLKVDVTAVTTVMSSAYATRFKILPIRVDKKKVIIATAEPFVRSWENELVHVSGLLIERIIANPVDISRYLNEFYSVSHSIRRATSDTQSKKIPGVANFEHLIELGKSGRLDTNDESVVHIVDWLLQYAFDQRASDIHMEPRRNTGHIRFRIDGALQVVNEMPTPVMAVVTSRIKVLGRMDVVEKRRPQDGRIKTKTPGGNEVELRLSTMPTAFGEKLVMRIFNPDVLVKDFAALGFGESDITRWDKMVTQPHGIVLVTGPTGSGKTTTLYSTLRQLAKPEVNVCTVEDPIEMIMPEFNQMQVQQNIGLDFASGIRTLMRQDPDIIMVGEIRDRETAQMAVQAALTGHLVLSTLHTNDVAGAVPRLREIGVPAYLINATLIGVLAQRLVRTLCPHCKKQSKIDADIWASLTRPWKINGKHEFYEAVGCDECRNTGFLGRAGLYELMPMTPSLRHNITPESDASIIRRQAINEGMTQLRISGARKIAMGLTTIEEVMKVVPPDEEL